MNDFHQLKNDLVTITTEVIDAAHLTQNDLFVLGCSTSEVVGGMIGKNSSEEVGYIIIKTIKEVLDPLGIRLAVQAPFLPPCPA